MGKSIEIQAPNKMETKEGYISVFLAGSIEMGKLKNGKEILLMY